METCEYRGRGGTTLKFTDAKITVGVANSDRRPTCEVKIERAIANVSVLELADPVCELTEISGADCPIAQFKRGEVDLEAANKQLKILFQSA